MSLQTTIPQPVQHAATSVQSWIPSVLTPISQHQSLLDWLKPHRSVAIARLKNNGFAMLVLLLVTQLSPITPSPFTCLWLVLTGGRGVNGWRYWSCCIELTVFSILAFNILQAYLGLKYPPRSCQPVDSPAKRAQLRSPPPVRPLRTYTPQSSTKKPSPFDSVYAPSPVSTPSRVINYKSVLGDSTSSSSSLFNSQNSSLFSRSGVASSPLAYRMRQSQNSSVRPLSASLLSKLGADDDDDE